MVDSGFVVMLVALIAPFILLPLEKFLIYPYLFEELTKALVLSKRSSYKFGLLFGSLFSLSENLLFFSSNLNTFLFVQRFFITGSMHIFTSLIICFFSKRKLLWAGMCLAVFVHFIFNKTVDGLFLGSYYIQ